MNSYFEAQPRRRTAGRCANVHIVTLANMDAQRIPITDVPRVIQRIRGGRRVSRQTAWRWATKGVRGIRLWSQWTGGILETTEAAVGEFLERSGRRERPKLRQRGGRRKEAIAQAWRVLKKFGLA